MGSFFSSLFSSPKQDNDSEEAKKNEQESKFDVFKYDGMSYQKMGKLNDAIRCYTQALLIKDDEEVLASLVTTYTMADRGDDALETVGRLIDLNPDAIEPRISRANILFMLDRDAEVVPDCEHILEIDPKNALACYLIAKSKRTADDKIGAVADLTKAISFNAEFPAAFSLRAEILLDMMQLDEALADAEEAIRLDPEEENSYVLRGQIFEKMGNLEKAHDDYQKVLDLNPFNEKAAVNVGRLMILQKDFDGAIAFFDDAIDTNPNFAAAYAERGHAKKEKGDEKGALEDLKKSLELDPESEEAKKMNGKHSNFDDMYKGGIF